MVASVVSVSEKQTQVVVSVRDAYVAGRDIHLGAPPASPPYSRNRPVFVQYLNPEILRCYGFPARDGKPRLTTAQALYATRLAVLATDVDAGKPCLVVGDTVASGAMVIAALDAYRQVHRLERLFLLSYAGSAVGARRIAEFCARLGVECTILYGLAAFGLGANGFDLSFAHPDTVTADVYRERARRLYGDRQVSGVGWDFGSQFMAPDKYRELSWLEARVHGLLDSPEFSFAREPRDLAFLARESAAFGDSVDPP